MHIQKNFTSAKSASHYRILRSFGSEIGLVNFTQEGKVLASITYINGDKCHDNPKLNYSSTINFVCDKSKNHFIPKIINFQNCNLNILWESPFACSECKFNETLNYTTSCMQGIRYTYLEENSNCIILYGLDGSFNVERLDKNTSINTYKINFSLSEQIDTEELLNKNQYKFVYYDTIITSCNEVRISYIYVLFFLGVGILVIILTLICIFVARRLKENYFLLLEEAKRLHPGTSFLLASTTINTFNLQTKERTEEKKS